MHPIAALNGAQGTVAVADGGTMNWMFGLPQHFVNTDGVSFFERSRGASERLTGSQVEHPELLKEYREQALKTEKAKEELHERKQMIALVKSRYLAKKKRNEEAKERFQKDINEKRRRWERQLEDVRSERCQTERELRRVHMEISALREHLDAGSPGVEINRKTL